MEKMSDKERLMRLRELLKLSQREMAEEFGVVHGAVGLWEQGKRKIPGPVMKLIALYEFELGVDDLDLKESYLEKIKSGWFERNMNLSNLSTALISHLSAQAKTLFLDDEKKNQVQLATNLALAKQVVGVLGSLKGLPQKFGQFASYMDLEASDEIREQYASLQAQSVAVHPGQIAEILVEDFRKTPFQLFADWSHKPFAAASLGQVHKAKTHDGDEVAVKVQYPGIQDVIKSDLKNIKLLDQLGKYLLPSHEPEQIMLEIAERTLEECNYLHEAKYQEELRRFQAKDERIVIPKVYADLSSERVLTMEYIKAKDFSEFCKTASPEEKNFAAEVIWDHLFTSLIKHQMFNADPHPGNYLFLPGKVVFLDFGLVKRISKPFFNSWMKFMCAVMSDDRKQVDACILEMGIVADAKKFQFDRFYSLMRAWYYPYYTKGEFEFNKELVLQHWKQMWEELGRNSQIRFPKELLYINQVQWGLHAILAELGAHSDWSRRFLPLLETR